MYRGKFISVAVLVALAAPLSLVQAGSGCEKELAEIDEALAEDGSLDENRRTMMKGLRDMAARYCDQGQEAMASRMLDGIRAQLVSESAADADANPGAIAKEKLTSDYLEGWWCALSTRYERRTPILFEPDGSHLVGQPAGDKYGMFPNGDEPKDFYRQFEHLVSLERNKFVVIDGRGREIVYERGRCDGIETAR